MENKITIQMKKDSLWLPTEDNIKKVKDALKFLEDNRDQYYDNFFLCLEKYHAKPWYKKLFRNADNPEYLKCFLLDVNFELHQHLEKLQEKKETPLWRRVKYRYLPEILEDGIEPLFFKMMQNVADWYGV